MPFLPFVPVSFLLVGVMSLPSVMERSAVGV